MSYFCEKCGKYVYTNSSHNCKEYTFLVQDTNGDYYGDMTAYGDTVENALEEVAVRYNDENDLVDDSIVAVHDGQSYLLSAELSIKYIVRKL